jgi:hypothetical protein
MGICAFIGNYENGIFFIKDLYTYNVNINFVEYYGSSSAIRYSWKHIIVGETIQPDRIWNEIV